VSPAVECPIEVRVAARWWADRLREVPKHQIVNDPRERSPRVSIMESMSVFAGLANNTLSDEQVDKFEELLAGKLAGKILGDESWERAKASGDPIVGSYGRTFGCDYNPDRMLRDSFLEAGGKHVMGVFPSKTMMWINPGSVQVRFGYGAKVEDLPLEVPSAE
jgi:hypothetical protein